MIPKIIHYCWFGKGKKSDLMQRCINSWKKFCPDYQIIEWNEDNFDVSKYEYTEYCYKNKKWAFLSDFVRLKVVFENGGIYLDTDVEVVKSFDPLLKYQAFFGFENENFLNSGIGFGAEKRHESLKIMLDEYTHLKEENIEGIKTVGCPILNTRAIEKYGFVINGKNQNIKGVQLFSAEYMNPYEDATGKLKKTENTYSIHWYSKSALSKGQKIRARITRPFHRIFGKDCFKNIRNRK